MAHGPLHWIGPGKGHQGPPTYHSPSSPPSRSSTSCRLLPPSWPPLPLAFALFCHLCGFCLHLLVVLWTSTLQLLISSLHPSERASTAAQPEQPAKRKSTQADASSYQHKLLATLDTVLDSLPVFSFHRFFHSTSILCAPACLPALASRFHQQPHPRHLDAPVLPATASRSDGDLAIC